MPNVTEEDFNNAAAKLIKQREAWKQNRWDSKEAACGRSEFDVIHSYLKHRAQVATSMNDERLIEACTSLMKKVNKVGYSAEAGIERSALLHEMSMLELDLRYFSAVTNEGRTRIA